LLPRKKIEKKKEEQQQKKEKKLTFTFVLIIENNRFDLSCVLFV